MFRRGRGRRTMRRGRRSFKSYRRRGRAGRSRIGGRGGIRVGFRM